MCKAYYADPAKAGWQHPITTERLDIKSKDPYPEQLKHFIRVVQGKEKPRTSGEDARRTLEATLAVLESGLTHQPIRV